jgi:hypothetical protein
MMQLLPVTDSVSARDFIKVNVVLNRNLPGYIRPLDKDVNAVFDPGQNRAFRQGECMRWILKDENGDFLGRIAAFVNKRYKTKGDEGPVGGIGFFDCIRNQEAADMLFDVARYWLIQQGMTAMDGPINFGERDTWWGLVTEGFHEPMYRMNFNPPYYKELFEQYGFQPFFNQICFGFNPKEQLSEKVRERYERVARDPAFRVQCIEKKNLEKYIRDFTSIYNKAWAGHGGMKQLREEQVRIMFRQMKPVMDERIIWFTYHLDEPIAVYINIPDLNQWFKYLNGRFGIFHKLKFLWVKKTRPNKKFAGIVFGVIPEYQSKGIDSFMIMEGEKITRKTDYTEYEMQWIGDFNVKMINLVMNVGDVFRSRVLTTYRYLFDRTREFKRHPFL